MCVVGSAVVEPYLVADVDRLRCSENHSAVPIAGFAGWNNWRAERPLPTFEIAGHGELHLDWPLLIIRALHVGIDREYPRKPEDATFARIRARAVELRPHHIEVVGVAEQRAHPFDAGQRSEIVAP